MSTKKNIEDFPSLVGATATLFRYDRWDDLFLFEINKGKGKERVFLVCYNCDFIEFDGYIDVDKVYVILDAETLIMKEPSHNFLLKCTSVELWNYDKFESYDLKLWEKLGENKHGIKKPIFSIEELQ
ncbi:hypothetical protein NIES4071_40800 [Calothrix sp. NIES-4071]|nr:hypothetical protein NIES4071_40800 [Calothrix sp. NIES-4071]BAZ58396.1 hypothetical protein NIES4105_40740 [Calothrix sp. NIES-4105]